MVGGILLWCSFSVAVWMAFKGNEYVRSWFGTAALYLGSSSGIGYIIYAFSIILRPNFSICMPLPHWPFRMDSSRIGTRL